MTLAKRTADDVARNHGRDPWKVARRLGLKVHRKKLPAPHRELYVQRHGNHQAAALAIAADARPEEARELVAHGIGHHLLHVGDRVTGNSGAIWSGRHEREAEDFAALLLVGPHRLRDLPGDSQQGDAACLSDECDISEKLARRRLRLG